MLIHSVEGKECAMIRELVGKKSRVLLLVATATIICAGTAISAETKLGQVDTNEVYNKSSKLQAARLSVQKAEADARAKLMGLRAEVEELEKKLKEAKDTLKADERENLEKQLTDKNEKFKTEIEALRVSVSFQKRNEQTLSRQRFFDAVAEVAKKQGVTLVLHANAVLYSTGVQDITNEVISAVDAKPDKPEDKPGPKPKGNEESTPKQDRK